MRSEGIAVESVCAVLGEQGVQVAARTYRAWKKRLPALRTIEDARITDALRALKVPDAKRRPRPEIIYGRRKMTQWLRRNGFAARVLSTVATVLDVDFDELSRLALDAEPGAGGVVLVPYFEGERTPNLPHAKASFHGLSIDSTTRPNIARAAIEGMLCGLAGGLDALRDQGGRAERLLLIGGAVQIPAVQRIAAQVFDLPVVIPSPGEYVARGAAVQAAWVLTGRRPDWPVALDATPEHDFRASIGRNYRTVSACIDTDARTAARQAAS